MGKNYDGAKASKNKFIIDTRNTNRTQRRSERMDNKFKLKKKKNISNQGKSKTL